MIKTLLTAEVLKNAYGGTRVYINELARGLLQHADLPLTVLTELPQHASGIPAECARLEFGAYRSFLRPLSYLAMSCDRLCAFDLIHCPLTVSPFCLSPVFRRKHRPAIVMTCLDIIPLTLPTYRSLLLTSYYWWWKRFVALHVDAFLAISEFTKLDMIRHLQIPEHKIHVTPLGVRPLNAPSDRVANGRPFFLAVSSVEPRKNFERTVEAFCELKKSKPDWPGCLKIVGDARHVSPRLKQQVAEMAGCVEMLGAVDDSRLAGLYRDALAFIYVSLYEGFGLPVAEAMANSCPVVASNLTSLPEVGGDAVLYVNPMETREIAAAMAQLIDNPLLRSDLVARGLERARLFTWARCAQLTVDVYRSVCGQIDRR